MPRYGLLIAACAAGLAFLVAPGHRSPLLIYNGSPSAPVGFYLRAGHTPSLGDYVIVRTVDAAPAYARERGFDDRSDRFIKRVAAVAGARVCARGNQVSVGSIVVTRYVRDDVRRPLPAWQGCRLLDPDEVFLLGDTDDSFDSRYWGPLRRSQIDGAWRPLRRAREG